MTIDPAFLDDLARLALAAGRDILAVYATDFDVSAKGDASPVTQADARAEATILEGLQRLAPGIPVVAEEEVSSGRMPENLGGRFFLVDPLDGTKEFISRNGEFTVNIALVEGDRPLAGIVLAPAIGAAFGGIVGGEAWTGRAQDGGIEDRRAIAVRRPDGGYEVLASRSHAGPETEAFLARLPVKSRVSAGSSLKLCCVAAGAADLYPRLGRTMEWDIAAGDAVLRAAGGSVVTFDGSPLVYGKRNQAHDSDFANPWFLACGAVDLAAVLAAAAHLPWKNSPAST